MTPQVSVLVPVYNEGDAIISFLDRLFECIDETTEVLVVFDSEDDTTRGPLVSYAEDEPRVHPVHNTDGPGPARALRFGFGQAKGDVVVVTMADGSDDPHQIQDLAHLVERGVVVAAASRYMQGGQQVGGPLLKSTMSRWAGLTLHWLARVGTRDATNSFKAYNREFVERVGIESEAGFEIGIELVAKARRHREPVAELPTIWLDRRAGASNFQVASWLPHYFRWYRYAFGPRLVASRPR